MTEASSPLVRRAAIVGPTASGKSAVAMHVAAEVGDCELVSVDSMQVYRGMEIGTATPSTAEQAEVPHHLLDIVEPTVDFTVAEFQQRYAAVLDDLAARSKSAILVGGTGLYQRAVIDDLNLPGEWPTIRARLEQEADEQGAEPLYRRLVAIDQQAADKIEPGNVRRIVRALEVCEGSGQPFSSFGPGIDHYPLSPVAQVGLRWSRELLTERIEQRVHQMMHEGFLAEVEALRDTELSRTASQAIGYRELLAHLDGGLSLDAAVEAIVLRTRQFAVRQERWFRRDPRVQWVDIESDPVAEAASALRSALVGDR